MTSLTRTEEDASTMNPFYYRSFILSLAATGTALLLAGTVAAQPRPGGGGMGQGIRPNVPVHGGFAHHGRGGYWPHSNCWHGHRHRYCYSRWGYYPYGYGYWDSAAYVYAAREQEYQAALLAQTLQYRAALLQLQAARRDQVNQKADLPQNPREPAHPER
jgi:hypothetical protein